MNYNECNKYRLADHELLDAALLVAADSRPVGILRGDYVDINTLLAIIMTTSSSATLLAGLFKNKLIRNLLILRY